MPETIHLEQDADGVFKAKEAQFLGDYPEQHQVVAALASGAVLLVNPADISGDEKAQKATELVINAAFDFAALFIPLPPGTVDFVKNQLIPYLVKKAFEVLKASGLLPKSQEPKLLA